MSGSAFNLVLYQPVIPQNTGSIARLCACTGAALHLIHPLGFRIDEASVKRAGLDYWPFVDVKSYENWSDFLDKQRPEHLHLFSKFATQPYHQAQFPSPLYLIFGSETTGLPKEIWDAHRADFYQIPMRTHLVRSLNLSQCAAIVLYEALRRQNFPL
jgi:tRNA (cytidine/uridine-2'-O-)-methyltransferase